MKKHVSLNLPIECRWLPKLPAIFTCTSRTQGSRHILAFYIVSLHEDPVETTVLYSRTVLGDREFKQRKQMVSLPARGFSLTNKTGDTHEKNPVLIFLVFVMTVYFFIAEPAATNVLLALKLDAAKHNGKGKGIDWTFILLICRRLFCEKSSDEPRIGEIVWLLKILHRDNSCVFLSETGG